MKWEDPVKVIDVGNKNQLQIPNPSSIINTVNGKTVGKERYYTFPPKCCVEIENL